MKQTNQAPLALVKKPSCDRSWWTNPSFRQADAAIPEDVLRRQQTYTWNDDAARIIGTEWGRT